MYFSIKSTPLILLPIFGKTFLTACKVELLTNTLGKQRLANFDTVWFNAWNLLAIAPPTKPNPNEPAVAVPKSCQSCNVSERLFVNKFVVPVNAVYPASIVPLVIPRLNTPAAALFVTTLPTLVVTPLLNA